MPRVRPLPPKIRRRAPLAVLPAALIGVMAIAVPALADAPNTSLDFNALADGPVSAATAGLGTTLGAPGALAAAGGVLQLTSAPPLDPNPAGAYVVNGATQANSYVIESDVTSGAAPDFKTLLASGFQEAGIFAGANTTSDWAKIVAQHKPGVTESWRIEFTSAGSVANPATASRIPPKTVDLTGVNCIRFSLQVNTVSKVVVGKYALSCTAGAPKTVMGFYPLASIGTTGSGGGITASNSGTPTTFTAGFDNFSVGADNGTDITAPTLKNRSPAADVTNVPTNASISATLSEKMSLASITSSTFKITRTSDGAPVATGEPTGDNTPAQPVFTITPTAPLSTGTQYTVSLNGFRDLAGNPLPATTWKFTTAGPPAPPAPPTGGGTTPAPAGSTTPPATGDTSAAVATGTNFVPPPPIVSIAGGKKLPLRASFSLYTKQVKAGKNGLITLRFNQVPKASRVIVQKKNGKKYAAIFHTKASKATTVVRFPVGKKLGTFTFRASYVDSGAVKYTAPFSVTIVK